MRWTRWGRLSPVNWAQKPFERSDAAFQPRQQEQMAAVEYLELRVRDQARQQPRVHERHDRIVVARHDERRLRDSMQPDALVQPASAHS